MQSEIDKEKQEGLGLPTEVTNQVAQAQMMGQVELEQQAQTAEIQSDTQNRQPQQQVQQKPEADLKLENTFSKLKRIL
jgi:hypothetical protein